MFYKWAVCPATLLCWLETQDCDLLCLGSLQCYWFGATVRGWRQGHAGYISHTATGLKHCPFYKPLPFLFFRELVWLSFTHLYQAWLWRRWEVPLSSFAFRWQYAHTHWQRLTAGLREQTDFSIFPITGRKKVQSLKKSKPYLEGSSMIIFNPMAKINIF